jgi:hypothetical protein
LHDPQLPAAHKKAAKDFHCTPIDAKISPTIADSSFLFFQPDLHSHVRDSTVDVKKAWLREDYRRATFGAKSGLVHNTIMEAAQRVRYPIERWPNEFARAEMIYETGIFTQNNRPYHIDTSSPTWNHLRYEHHADGILWAHQD